MATNYRYDEKANAYVPIDEEEKKDYFKDEKLIGVLLWVMMFFDWSFIPIIISAVAYSYYRDRSPFLATIARETLNFQISLILYWIFALISSLLTFGMSLIVLVPVLLIYMIVIPILGIVRAVNGNTYIPHFTIRLIK